MKVGEYVRTKSGGIGKIIEIDNNASCSHIITDNETFGLGWDGEQVNWDFIIEIVKSSPNIIDLIDDGDIIHYHNEYIDFISPVIIYDDGEIASNLYDSDGYIFLDKEKDKNNIKSIITKEQFEAMEYKCE